VQIIAVMSLIGFTISLGKKEFLLPTWVALPLLIEPRSAPVYITIPLAMLAGWALTEYILPTLQKRKINSSVPERVHVLNSTTTRVFLGFLIIYSVMSSYSITSTIQRDLTINNADTQAFQWVTSNTSVDSKFLVLTGQHHLRDAISEWFPVLAQRRSQATVFGYEWVPDGRFRQRIDEYKNLQACLYENTLCLDNWSQQVGADYTYIYLWNRSDPERFPISIYLQENMEYKLVFQNEQTIIYHKLR